MFSEFLTLYLAPVAVIVSAAATTSTAVFAWRMHKTVNIHERALFGEQNVHNGLVDAVNDNTEMTDKHRRVLREHDLIDDAVHSQQTDTDTRRIT